MTSNERRDIVKRISERIVVLLTLGLDDVELAAELAEEAELLALTALALVRA